EIDYGGYQQVAGVWFPFAIETSLKGGGGGGGGRGGAGANQRILVERAEVNVAVEDAWFKLPAPRTRTGPVISAGPPEAKAITAAVTPPPPSEKATLDGGTISGLDARNIG